MKRLFLCFDQVNGTINGTTEAIMSTRPGEEMPFLMIKRLLLESADVLAFTMAKSLPEKLEYGGTGISATITFRVEELRP